LSERPLARCRRAARPFRTAAASETLWQKESSRGKKCQGAKKSAGHLRRERSDGETRRKKFPSAFGGSGASPARDFEAPNRFVHVFLANARRTRCEDLTQVESRSQRRVHQTLAAMQQGSQQFRNSIPRRADCEPLSPSQTKRPLAASRQARPPPPSKAAATVGRIKEKSRVRSAESGHYGW
jgi:hypothetical protein